MNRTTKVLLGLALLAIFLIPFLWYTDGKLIIGGDLTFPLRPAEYFFSIFQIWRRVYTGTNSAISLTTLPFYAPMALFDALGFSLQTLQKFHFGLWLALPAVSMYYLAGVLFKDHPQKRVAQLVAVSIFLFNTYEVVWADSARMTIWVGLPLMFGFFIEGLTTKKSWLPWAAGIALTSMITSTAAINPPMYLMFLAIFVFWLIFHFATHQQDRNLKKILSVLGFILTALILTVAVNLYWVIPYANFLINEYKNSFTAGVAGLNLSNWLDPLSTNTSLLNMFRLQGAWDWYSGWNNEMYVPAANLYQTGRFHLLWSVFIPILAFIPLLFHTKNARIDRRKVWFFSGLALLGLFLGAGSHLPTGALYKWLVMHFPFLSIYRSPWYKFTTWTVFAYSYLGALTVAEGYNWLVTKKPALTHKIKLPTLPVWLAPVILAVFMIANTIYAGGLVFGKVFPRADERKNLPAAHVQFPDYFTQAADWINQQPGTFRILQLPAQSTFDYDWGLSTLMDMTIFTFKQPTIWWPEQVGGGTAKAGSESLAKATFETIYRGKQPNLGRLLGILNIGYLLEKTDINYKFYGGTDSPEFIAKKLSNVIGVSLAKTIGKWQFYSLSDELKRPLIFTTNRIEQTGPTVDIMAKSILSNRFNPSITYSDEPTLPSTTTIKVPTQASFWPDLTAAKADGKAFVMPVTVSADGSYRLVGYSPDQTDVTLNKVTINFSTINKTLVSQPVQLTKGISQLSIRPSGQEQNLIQNPSFEEGIWDKVIDASSSRSGGSKVSGMVVNDGTDGKKAVKLTTAGHAAAIRKGIDQFEADRYYLISFDYKWGKGEAPRYAVSQEGSLVIDPIGNLPKSSDWQSFSVLFRPASQSTGAYLFLYADDNDKGTPTESYYDNVKIVKLPQSIEQLALVSSSELTDSSSDTASPTVDFTQVSSSRYTAKVSASDQPYILNFLEQYDAGWVAKVNGKVVPGAQHFRSFGYANSWLLPAGEQSTIELIFTPQRTFVLAALFSILAFLITISLVLIPFYLRKKNGSSKGSK